MKIKGELKAKLDAAMIKSVEYAKTLGADVSIPFNKKEQWTILHWAMTKPECAAQNIEPMNKIMNEVYKECNDDHLQTYLKQYFKN